MSESPAKRRRVRFGLRTAFVIVFGVAVLLAAVFGSAAMLASSKKWIGDRHAALSQYKVGIAERPTHAPWRIRLLGEEGVPVLVVSFSTSAAERDGLQRLFPEARVVPCD